MSRIAISYRREDSMDITGRIFDRLVGRYGRSAVFLDIEKIPPGMDFRDHLKKVIGGSDVLMVVVGPDWAGSDEQGHSRLRDEKDFVRTEVEIALAGGIQIIPLLVGEASMPQPAVLPDSLKDFTYRHAYTIDSGRDFDHHIKGLLGVTDEILKGKKTSLSTDSTAQVAKPSAEKGELQGNMFFPIVGGVMTAQGFMHIAWFIRNLALSYNSGTVGKMFIDVWSYADIAFGFGGVVIGLGTILGKYWARFGGIILCLLASFSNLLWFIDIFDKGLPRLILSGTAFALLLFVLGIYLYVFKWPQPLKR